MNFNRYNIEREISSSHRRRNAIVIKLKNSTDIFVTAVKSYRPSAGLKTVEFEQTTLYGHPIPKPSVLLSEIEGVMPISVHFDDPVYVRARQVKAKFIKEK